MFNVLDYGAKGDGITLDTQAIQKAIDDCAESGGGQVLLPGGRVYRAGTIILRSHVDFHIESGAILKASDEIGDFNGLHLMAEIPKGMRVPSYSACDYDGNPSLYFVYAKDAEDISLSGQGTIDGNESIFYGEVTETHIDGSFYPRAPLVFLENITHLSVNSLTLCGSAFWTLHMVGCRDVLVDGIRVLNNLRLANCDSIDPDHCQNVRIANCYLQSADDGIVFKNTAANRKYGACENIVVTNCTILTTSAAFKFGSESEDLFRDIIVSNCQVMTHSNRGISLQLRDQGSIENVLFENMIIHSEVKRKPFFWGDGEPIAITANRRTKDGGIGHIRHVTFRNILCEGENGIFLYGDTDEEGKAKGNISDITFDHVQVLLIRTGSEPWDTYDIRPCYQDGILSEKHHAFYAEHTGRVVVRECSFTVNHTVKNSVAEAIKIHDSDTVIQ
ncbi:MAG: glycosyl hydrolase family 28 protein [Oribacterium sp.]|nr:glycosyl hydrolase family 28 protein [Oribacterium sp.]